MDKAALYLRLSKEDVDKVNKNDASESIINQRLLLTDYAIKHDFLIVDVYSDDDYSGLYDDRPEFDRLIRDSKLGKFNIVIAKTQSRFTRNMEHMEKYLHHDFPLLGIRFIGVVDGVDTQNVANKKARQINGLVNEWYCEDLSNNIRAVFRQKMKAGQFVGAFAPYGYLKNPKDNHKFVIDEYAAGVVRKIYSLFLDGYSVRSIAHYLEDEGIPNPTNYKKSLGLHYENKQSNEFSIKYGLWSTTTIKRILSNETYLGTLIQGSYTKVSYKDKKVVAAPKEDWVIVENHHEPIINEDIFYKVSKLRSQRRISATNQGKNKKVHIFAGKLKCAACGHTMIKSGGVRGKKDDWYLRCQLANKSRLKQCTSHNIKFSVLQEIVHIKIKEMVDIALGNVQYFDEIAKAISSRNEEDALRKEKKKLHDISVKIDEVTKSVKILYLDRLNQNLDEDMFFQLKKEFEEELKTLNEKKKEAEQEIKRINHNISFQEDINNIVKRHTDYSVLTHSIVNDFIDYIEVGEKNKQTQEQEIIIHWNF